MIRLGAPVRRSPLGRAQASVWLAHQRDPASSAYHEPFVLTLDGPLDVAALEHALAAMLRRHGILRATYETVDGEPAQVTRELLGVDLPVHDSAAQAGDPPPFTDALGRPFDLEREAPLRLVLRRLASGRHELLVVRHHIATDGWSLGIMLGDIASGYAAARGAGPEPAPPGVQFADLAEAACTETGRHRAEQDLRWWEDHLEACPVSVAFPPPPADSDGPVSFEVIRQAGAEIVAGIRRQAAMSGTPPFAWLATAVAMAVARWHPGGPVPVGTSVAGRDGGTDAAVIGCFSSVITLRIDLPGHRRAGAAARAVAREIAAALSHAWLDPARLAARRGMPSVVLAFQDIPGFSADGPGTVIAGVRVGMRSVAPPDAKFDLALTVSPLAAGGWELSARSRRDRLPDAVAAQVADDVLALLTAMARPDPLAGTPPDGPTLLALALSRAPAGADAPAAPVHAMPGAEASLAASVPAAVTRAARQRPDAVAVRRGPAQVTRRGLVARARAIATALPAGLTGETPVVLWLPPGPDLVAAELAIMSLGAVFVPQDRRTAWPVIARCRARAGAPLVLTDAAGLAESAGDEGILDLARLTRPGPGRPAAGDAGRPVAPDQAAYVIYTSGSTGEPKGVVVPHRSVLELAAETAGLVVRAPGERWSWVHSAGFDLSIWEIWVALILGAEVVWIEPDVTADARLLRDRLIRERVNHLTQTPTAFGRLSAGWGQRAGRPRLVVLAGEKCLAAAVGDWLGGGRQVINMFGITETTVHATAQILDTRWTRRDTESPVGPLLALRAGQLTDRFGAPAPPGAVGELLLGGGGLARGYLRRPDLTAASFVPAPWGPPGARAYRSGDLLALRPGPLLDYQARRDQQISLRGYRIEPGEVRAALVSAGGLRDAAVGVSGEGDAAVLCAWVVPGADGLDPRELRRRLAGLLPAHLVPAAIVTMDALPVTGNGKLARDRLPAAVLGDGLRGRDEPESDLQRRLGALWSEITGGPAPALDDRFVDVGAHSLVMVRLADRLERTYGVTFDLAELTQIPTLRELAGAVELAVARDGGSVQDLEELAGLLESALRDQP